MSPRTGLELARTSTQVPIGGYLDDTYVAGRLVENSQRIKLRSLNPLFGQRVLDEYLSICPFLSFIRIAFNPILESTGSADSQMTYNSPRFVFCLCVDFLNYEYLFPFGLNFHTFDHFCRVMKWYNVDDATDFLNYSEYSAEFLSPRDLKNLAKWVKLCIYPLTPRITNTTIASWYS